jgi:6-phosphogluconolactonase (cycloisomerase 2 family)
MTLTSRASRALATAFALSTLAVAAAHAGQVYTSSNGVAGNALLVFQAAADGSLSPLGQVPTGGTGTGAGLGSQGAVTLSTDGQYVFVVNAGSQTVSTFALAADGMPQLKSVVDAGGLMPISVTEHDGLVAVLDAGGAGNIATFRNMGGQLQPLADGVRPLSAAGGVGPAQVGFSDTGEALVVTEKNTNKLTTYRVRSDGTPGQPKPYDSAGMTPFGFAFDRRDHLLVSEAQGGATDASTASSYRFLDRAPSFPMLVSASVPTQQTAACWVAVTPNGRYAYTGNAGSNSVSSYAISLDGRITLLAAAAGSTGPSAGVTDLAVATSGRQLFALAPKSLQIVRFTVGGDGSLAMTGAATGLPMGVAGLAAN